MAFYDWYLGYATMQGNPLADRAYRQADQLSPDLIRRVDEQISSPAGVGLDPFLCAQDVPEYVEIEPAQVGEGRAEAVVHSSFEGHQFRVELSQSGSRWLIAAILCRP